MELKKIKNCHWHVKFYHDKRNSLKIKPVPRDGTVVVPGVTCVWTSVFVRAVVTILASVTASAGVDETPVAAPPQPYVASWERHEPVAAPPQPCVASWERHKETQVWL